ncbi:hypothetical protein V2G26_014534 [Clonostachys chloroleuca]
MHVVSGLLDTVVEDILFPVSTSPSPSISRHAGGAVEENKTRKKQPPAAPLVSSTIVDTISLPAVPGGFLTLGLFSLAQESRCISHHLDSRFGQHSS